MRIGLRRDNDRGFSGETGAVFAATAEFTLPLWYLLLIFRPDQWALAERALTVYRHGAQSFFSHQADRVMQLAEADAPLVVSLGSASLRYIAADASLKLLEMCNGLQVADDHSSLSFRHGPKLIVNQPVAVIVYLSPDEEILRYDLDMAAELKAQRHPLGKVVGIYAAEDPRAALSAYCRGIRQRIEFGDYPLGSLLPPWLADPSLPVGLSDKMAQLDLRHHTVILHDATRQPSPCTIPVSLLCIHPACFSPRMRRRDTVSLNGKEKHHGNSQYSLIAHR
ncbi:hypothetical protein [Sodalis sp. RH16]|uniref:hypothetical protein n=1 Tax=Sodalis sp. RH16 TaxID=3394331 RepID=UPI0039B3CB60